ncbi:cupin domain-containing protein [Petralouisia muris]|uniref:Cupin domain-containing protein n=1 Tax=Petralouisia muris TaxID=3032872 RepID=A0AC61RSD3_9FIRM|nr:alcohol dehydrogenase catalytic domain-containing protein [Petralouisia muris]TGY92661.1 cupin domain-containing protein [Petralouisia muris]
MKLQLKERAAHELFQGKGDAIICDIASSDMMHSKNRCFITIRLRQGASLGLHRHEKESEIYFIMQGRGLYTDNGEEYEIKAGQIKVSYCGICGSDIHILQGSEDHRMHLPSVIGHEMFWDSLVCRE